MSLVRRGPAPGSARPRDPLPIGNIFCAPQVGICFVLWMTRCLRPNDCRGLSARIAFRTASGKAAWGGATSPVTRKAAWSRGFMRWDLPSNFDNVHAHPAPPQQVVGHFNYSMPFPALSEYHCALALFNPNEEESHGSVRVVDRLGRAVGQQAYRLNPHQTVLYRLGELETVATPGEAFAVKPLKEAKLADGGVVVIHNDSEKVAFGYTFMKGRQGNSFTVEHPLHFSADAPMKPARETPYGPNKSFPASALLYTPLLFKGLRV